MLLERITGCQSKLLPVLKRAGRLQVQGRGMMGKGIKLKIAISIPLPFIPLPCL
jgi:hypothetical protein